jgi:hypothetical protein
MQYIKSAQLLGALKDKLSEYDLEYRYTTNALEIILLRPFITVRKTR